MANENCTEEQALEVRPVNYAHVARQARQFASETGIRPALEDSATTALLLVDCQLTFCHPEFELFVAGAVADTQRVVDFIYRNLSNLTTIIATLDTHSATQIFFDSFFVNEEGEHPTPLVSDLSVEALERGDWRVAPAAAASIGMDLDELTKHVLHYVRELAKSGKYRLTIWPYHAMLGGIGHSLVPALEAACFFHSQSRRCSTRFVTKGSNPLTENYSALRPEVLTSHSGNAIAQKNTALIESLLAFDRVIVAGQAKSHCVASTIEDFLIEIESRDRALARKVYLLEDCTSAVVIPGVVDYTAQADEAYAKFARAGMHIVKSTESMETWPE